MAWMGISALRGDVVILLLAAIIGARATVILLVQAASFVTRELVRQDEEFAYYRRESRRYRLEDRQAKKEAIL